MATMKAFLATASALALLAAAPVSALSVSTNGSGSAAVNVGTGVSVNAGGSASASGGVGTNADTDTDMGSGSSTTGSASSGTSANAAASGSANLSIPLVVTQADVSSGTTQAVQISADKVQTTNDLSGYIAAQMQGDANLMSVDTASDHVAVTYQEPAKFLGIFPITVDTTATTDASGNVSVSQPWWAFLATTNNAQLQANVQSSVSSIIGASGSANAQLSASQQARLVSAIKTVLAAAANANASASASGSTTVNTQ